MSVAGLLLAAGAGTRMGRPKALVHDDDGPWLGRGVATLTGGGCATVTVVLGAGADDAVPLLDGLGVDLVLAADWAEGMSASLRAGLQALAGSAATACLVHLVDLPDVTPAVVARLRRRRPPTGPTSWPGRRTTAAPATPCCSAATTGPACWSRWPATRAPAATSPPTPPPRVECGDLATGHDVDRPPA